MKILDRLLAAKASDAAERPGIAPLLQKHLDDIEGAAKCGCEHRSFTKTNSA